MSPARPGAPVVRPFRAGRVVPPPNLTGFTGSALTFQPVGSPSGGPWVQVFGDEFDTAHAGFGSQGAPDPAVWADHLIDGDAARSNDNASEVEWYPHNKAGLQVSGGALSLIARHESPGNVASAGYDPLYTGTNFAGNAATYTSGMVQSKPGFAFTHPSYLEGRFRMPLQGVDWPAFWGVAADQVWPPEYDLFEEFFGSDQFTSSYHPTAGGTASNTDTSGGLSGYRVYGMRRTAAALDFFLDGAHLWTATGWDATTLPWIIVINYAILSGTGGTYPAQLDCDYVRAWVTSGVPAQPSVTSISPSSGIPTAGSAVVSFGAVSGATTYRVTPCPVDAVADGSPASRLSVTGAGSPLTVTGLTNGARYTFSVAAVNGTGYSIESLPVPSL